MNKSECKRVSGGECECERECKQSGGDKQGEGQSASDREGASESGSESDSDLYSDSDSDSASASASDNDNDNASDAQDTAHSAQQLASATKHERWTDHLHTRCRTGVDQVRTRSCWQEVQGGAKHLLPARLGLHLVYTCSTLGLHMVYNYTSFVSIVNLFMF